MAKRTPKIHLHSIALSDSQCFAICGRDVESGRCTTSESEYTCENCSQALEIEYQGYAPVDSDNRHTP